MTKRLACPPAPGPLEDHAAQFDPLLARLAQRRGFRAYLEGVLLRAGCQAVGTPRGKATTGHGNP